MFTEYYDTLSIETTATDKEIKRAYKVASNATHPDKAGGDESKFKEVTEAYEVLIDEEKRKIYDELGKAGLDVDEDALMNSLLKEIYNIKNVNDIVDPYNNLAHLIGQLNNQILSLDAIVDGLGINIDKLKEGDTEGYSNCLAQLEAALERHTAQLKRLKEAMEVANEIRLELETIYKVLEMEII